MGSVGGAEVRVSREDEYTTPDVSEASTQKKAARPIMARPAAMRKRAARVRRGPRKASFSSFSIAGWEIKVGSACEERAQGPSGNYKGVGKGCDRERCEWANPRSLPPLRTFSAGPRDDTGQVVGLRMGSSVRTYRWISPYECALVEHPLRSYFDGAQHERPHAPWNGFRLGG